jgi:hypothetical protein
MNASSKRANEISTTATKSLDLDLASEQRLAAASQVRSIIWEQDFDQLWEMTAAIGPKAHTSLLRVGVCEDAITDCYADFGFWAGTEIYPASLRVARVTFPQAGWFEFSRDGAMAFILPAINADGHRVDLIAWDAISGTVASYFGTATLQDGREINTQGIGDTEGLVVHADPLAWLKAERRGVFLVPSIFRPDIVHRPLIVTSRELKRHLEKLLTIGPDIILQTEQKRVDG